MRTGSASVMVGVESQRVERSEADELAGLLIEFSVTPFRCYGYLLSVGSA
jgi:hypothetical protein